MYKSRHTIRGKSQKSYPTSLGHNTFYILIGRAQSHWQRASGEIF